MKLQLTPPTSRGVARGPKRKVSEWGWLTGIDLQQTWGIGSKPVNPGESAKRKPAKRATKGFAAHRT
ncbi:MAG: hypothetical protein KGL42_00250 [Betaproteobacteria bacterium]|nr:hypothetical protein [Betaproteobacteria bacterium]